MSQFRGYVTVTPVFVQYYKRLLFLFWPLFSFWTLTPRVIDFHRDGLRTPHSGRRRLSLPRLHSTETLTVTLLTFSALNPVYFPTYSLWPPGRPSNSYVTVVQSTVVVDPCRSDQVPTRHQSTPVVVLFLSFWYPCPHHPLLPFSVRSFYVGSPFFRSVLRRLWSYFPLQVSWPPDLLHEATFSTFLPSNTSSLNSDVTLQCQPVLRRVTHLPLSSHLHF